MRGASSSKSETSAAGSSANAGVNGVEDQVDDSDECLLHVNEEVVEFETIRINLAEAGTKAMRFLANIHSTHPKSCHIDLRRYQR